MRNVLFRRHLWPLLVLILLPVLGNAFVVSGWLHNNPAILWSMLTKSMQPAPMNPHLIPGNMVPGIVDPTIALLTQPLGMLSAKDWLHGIVPWWNPYSGLGMPLAAEMQTLSFFLPFVLVLKFWPGWLALKLIIQAMCGLFTYALMIELGTTRAAALIAGGFYALNATFLFVPHVMGPMPFGPLLLLGIERARRAAAEGRPRGWGLIPLALAYLIYGGYPEVAYVFGILAAAWTIWRFAGLGTARWWFAGKIGLGLGLGLALTVPLLVPFLEYVGLSYLGHHASTFSWLFYGHQGAPAVILPFIYGPINGLVPAGVPPELARYLTGFWGQLGGWFGPVAALFALAGIASSRWRGPAVLLAGFILVWLARLWGFTPATWVVNAIPWMAQTDSIRFCWPAIELSCFILAGFAVDSWQHDGALGGRRAMMVGGTAAAIVGATIVIALAALVAWYRALPDRLAFGLSATLVEIALAGLGFALLCRRPSRGSAFLLVGVVLADPLGSALVTTLGAPRGGTLDYAGVAYLQRHQGQFRFYTLQPFSPDYAAAFDLASINENALPVPLAWSRYLRERLDPYSTPILFTGWLPRDLGCYLLPAAHAALEQGVFLRPQRSIMRPSQASELRRHLAAFEAAGVKYVLAPRGLDPFAASARLPVDRQAPVAMALRPGDSIGGMVPPGVLDVRRINQVRVLIGTYAGAARGPFVVKLCVGGDCATGQADLAKALDNRDLNVRLDHTLPVPADAALRYTITHPEGTPVAIWLGTVDPLAPASLQAGAKGRAPILDLGYRAEDAPQAVHADAVMKIYRLPHPAPMFSTGGTCTLAPDGLDRVRADCPKPARLVRLEENYPGWQALVNGNPAPVATAREIFQAVALPAGRSEVRFFFRPPFTRTSCAIALAALLAWIGLMLWPAGKARREAGRKEGRK